MTTTTARTFEDTLAWIKAHPAKHKATSPVGALDGGLWATSNNSWCEMLMNNAGGFSQAFSTATLAGDASGGLDPRPETAVAGDFVYWTNHVGLVTRPGFMICASQIFMNNGTGYGEISFAEYGRLRPSQIWRGHSKRHGSQTLKPTPVPKPAPAPAPIPDPPTPADRIYIPIGVQIHAGQSYKIGAYEFTVLADGRTVVRMWASGHIHTVLGTGMPGSYTTFQTDGNVVSNWIDPKGKRHTQWYTGTQSKAKNGQFILFTNGALAIFTSKHVLIRKWG